MKVVNENLRKFDLNNNATSIHGQFNINLKFKLCFPEK